MEQPVILAPPVEETVASCELDDLEILYVARENVDDAKRYIGPLNEKARKRTKDGGLRRLFRKHLPEVHWTTVETGLAESGVPDLHGMFFGCGFWIECKLARGWEVGLRPMQIGWIMRHERSGGHVVVAVRKRDELFLVRGAYADQARELGLRGLPRGALLGQWSGGPASWPWQHILLALMVA